MRLWLSNKLMRLALWLSRESVVALFVDANAMRELLGRAECDDPQDVACTALDVYDSLLEFDALGYGLFVHSALGDHVVQLRGLRPDDHRATEVPAGPDDPDWN